MTLHFDRVKRGDLITAELMNSILDALENLDARIGTSTTPSPSGHLAITYVTPQPVTMGTNLTVVGANFGKANENVITVGGKTIDQSKISPASTDNVLIIEVPAVVVQSDGSALLTIDNPKTGYAQKTIYLVAANAPSLYGDLRVKMTQPPSGKLDPGVHTFIFIIHAETTLTDTYKVSGTVDLGWGVDLTTMDDKPLDTMLIPQSPSPGIDVSLKANVTIPTGVNGTAAKLTVTVYSQSTPTFQNFQTIDLIAGGEAPSKETVDVVLDPQLPVFPPTMGSFNTTTKRLEIKGTSRVTVLLQATTIKTQNYTIEGPSIQGDVGSKWKTELHMSSATLVSTAGVSNPINIYLTASSGAAQASLVVTVKAADDPKDTGTLNLPIALVT